MATNASKAWAPRSADPWPPVPTYGVYGTYHAWRLMRIWLRENSGIFQCADEAGRG